MGANFAVFISGNRPMPVRQNDGIEFDQPADGKTIFILAGEEKNDLLQGKICQDINVEGDGGMDKITPKEPFVGLEVHGFVGLGLHHSGKVRVAGSETRYIQGADLYILIRIRNDNIIEQVPETIPVQVSAELQVRVAGQNNKFGVMPFNDLFDLFVFERVGPVGMEIHPEVVPDPFAEGIDFQAADVGGIIGHDPIEVRLADFIKVDDCYVTKSKLGQ
jgi:hypothetical protein